MDRGLEAFQEFQMPSFFVFLQFVYYPHRAALAFRRMEKEISENNFVKAKENIEKAYFSFPYFKVYEKYYHAFR